MIEQLNTAFKDVIYLDSKHQYFIENKKVLSVTQFLGKVKPKFRSDFWAVYKAYEFSGYAVKFIWNNYKYFKVFTSEEDFQLINIEDDHSHLKVTPEEVLAQWKLDSLMGTTRGSFIHDYLENLENRILDEPKIELIDGLTIPQTINYINSFNTAKTLCKSYLEYAKENLVLVAAEYVIGSKQLGLAGRFDRLYFNKMTNEYEVWDFKNDKKIKSSGGFEKFELFSLSDNEMTKYSLQTSIYKKIIQDAIPDIKIGTSRIVWFDIKNSEYKIIDCIDYTELITTLSNEENWRLYINA